MINSKCIFYITMEESSFPISSLSLRDFFVCLGRGELLAFLPAAQVSLCSSFSSVVSKTQQVFSMSINAWK